MNLEKAVLENLKQLPLPQQQEVLDFSEFLKQKNSTVTPSPDSHLTPEEKIAKWDKVTAKLPQTSANLPEPLEDLIEQSAEQDQKLTPQERTEKWLAFVQTLPPQSANLPDEALHRDTMYD
jgi:hypothetical protein